MSMPTPCSWIATSTTISTPRRRVTSFRKPCSRTVTLTIDRPTAASRGHAVHVFGNAVWLDELLPLCRERNIKVIEDAAESIGRSTRRQFKGRHTGTVGDIGACRSMATRSSHRARHDPYRPPRVRRPSEISHHPAKDDEVDLFQ